MSFVVTVLVLHMQGENVDAANEESTELIPPRKFKKQKTGESSQALTNHTSILAKANENLSSLGSKAVNAPTIAGPPANDNPAEWHCAMAIYTTLCSTPNGIEKEMGMMSLQQQAVKMKYDIMAQKEQQQLHHQQQYSFHNPFMSQSGVQPPGILSYQRAIDPMARLSSSAAAYLYVPPSQQEVAGREVAQSSSVAGSSDIAGTSSQRSPIIDVTGPTYHQLD